MIKLSKRLKRIVQNVDRDKLVADIGTDHGFVPNFLCDNNITKNIIASDISMGSLEKSINFTKFRKNEKYIKNIISDGLTNIFEAEEIIIAGMGGILISNILKNKMELSKKAEKLILQPMQQVSELREFLYENGFDILKEEVVEEDDKFFEIIIGKYDGFKRKYNKFDLYISKYLRDNPSNEFIEFLKYKIRYNNYIKNKMELNTKRALEKFDEINLENEKIRGVLNELQSK